MNTKEYLEQVAYVSEMNIVNELVAVYKSKFDDSYITHVGMEDTIEFLADREITEELTHGFGFSPKDNKWYGWSHRAIYGFTIGSKCRKGDAHYRASSLEEELENAISFWSDEHHLNVKAKWVEKGEIYVSWEYSSDVPNKDLRNGISGVSERYDTDFGRGEWEAKTMEDAKQMAIDFNRGVA